MEEDKPKCTKKAFPDPLSADLAIDTISKKAVANGQKSFPVKSYKCPDCGEWHLTSQATREEMNKAIKDVMMNEKTVEFEKKLSAKSTRKKVWIKN